MHTDPIYILLSRALSIFLLAGASLAVLSGLLLIFRSSLMQCINRVANRWISMRNFEHMLDHSISLERWFHRHHGVSGIAIVLGSLYILVYFGFQFDKGTVQHRLAGVSPGLLGGLLDALVIASLLGAAMGVCIGLFLWLRPGLLRGIEAFANRWISLRPVTDVLDAPHSQVEDFVLRHSRRVGWLLLFGGAYLFFLMFRLLV